MDLNMLVSALVYLIITKTRLIVADVRVASFTTYYTNRTLDHYINLTAKSLVKCSILCKLNKCSAFRYHVMDSTDIHNRCLLYDVSVRSKLTDIRTPNAVSIQVVDIPLPDTFLDCQEAHEYSIRTPGLYMLEPPSQDPFYAWCDFDDLHGYTVIQRRTGDTDFYLNWSDYKLGFGIDVLSMSPSQSVGFDYWLGNDKIHALSQMNVSLIINLESWTGTDVTARYSTFKISNESDNYRLTVSGYSGDANDSLTFHSGQKFSTRDRDNDLDATNCATRFIGAWWYRGGGTKECYKSHLNGVWTSSSTGGGSNIVWYGSWIQFTHTISKSTMSITRD